jgi:hypothetical protein
MESHGFSERIAGLLEIWVTRLCFLNMPPEFFRKIRKIIPKFQGPPDGALAGVL